MPKTKEKYWSFPKNVNLLTGFYIDPKEEKKDRSTIYVPNISVSRSSNAGQKQRA